MPADLSPPIELPADLPAFAEIRGRAGELTSVKAVVVAALENQRLEALRSALDQGIAELDAGAVTTPAGLVAEVATELGLDT